MKLQLALDTYSLHKAIELVNNLRYSIDIIEIGTPFLLEEGFHAVREMRRLFPDKEIFADTKIMDAGKLEAEGAFKAGADYVSVLGVTDSATVQEAVAAANTFGKKVVIDLMNVKNLVEKVAQLADLGVEAIAIHTGVDQQRTGRTPITDLIEVQPYVTGMQTFIAGGITRGTLGEYIIQKPNVIIIGGGICDASDPIQEAHWIKTQLPQHIK